MRQAGPPAEPDRAPAADGRAYVALGARLRFLRQHRQLSLRELAARSGTSASFLSQLERGQCGSSLATLVQLAAALGLTVGDFFDPQPAVSHRVLTRAERPTLDAVDGLTKTLLTARPASSVEVFGGVLQPGRSTGATPYAHGASHEVFIVLSGEVQLELDGFSHVLGEGDSIEYATSLPHRTRNTGDRPAEVLWVVSPPT